MVQAMNDRKIKKPTIDLLNSVRDLLMLNISDERLVDVLRGLNANWEFYEAMGSISLDKEDDPSRYLASLISVGLKPEQG
jgi:hypothetical protein